MKKYSVTIYTSAGRSHRFKWSCNEAMASQKTPYDIFMGLPYVKVKDTATEKVYVDTKSICEISFKERKE